ncbi:MAG TPA: hypothetical protein VMZ11_05250 [Mycobacteriales bacterium]|nr:hypothetical protein [Mycobacteriales bacterium]
MRWVLLDVAIALAALGFLAKVLLGLWRRVKVLFTAVGEAGEAVAVASDALAAAQERSAPHRGSPAYPVGTSNEERA